MTEQSTASALFNGKVTLWQYVEDLDKAVQWYQEVLGLTYAHDIVWLIFLRSTNTLNWLLAIFTWEKGRKAIVLEV